MCVPYIKIRNYGERKMKKVNWIVVIAGAVVGIAAVVLTLLGNPANMGFCIACFLRDIAGGVGMHSAAKVQYVRPEIIGLVLGAFLMALAAKDAPCDLFLVDAIDRLDVAGEVRGIVHGDALCYSIAAASILAKVTRDRLMRELDETYPQYGFAKNKGYGTAQHIAALKAYGPCPAHRRSFIGHFVEV